MENAVKIESHPDHKEFVPMLLSMFSMYGDYINDLAIIDNLKISMTGFSILELKSITDVGMEI